MIFEYTHSVCRLTCALCGELDKNDDIGVSHGPVFVLQWGDYVYGVLVRNSSNVCLIPEAPQRQDDPERDTPTSLMRLQSK